MWGLVTGHVAVRKSSQTQLEVRESVFTLVHQFRASQTPGLTLLCVLETSLASIFISTGLEESRDSPCLLVEVQKKAGNWELFQL